ncbi:PREDICTED: hepatoma-derived growth factor-related protein 2, partial [Apaloderma vittatum]|uniref:hepatoma-derived growth factor-related protein 2 n=1 Tax=Apaloderma vittatum TaxID=57397 RepID=UPI0005217DCA
MPVAKRPRKSSSDLDQGSPSLTEEENSETSSESEKNSDQDFTPEKKPVARAPRRVPPAGRKKKKVESASDSDSKVDSDSEMGNAAVDMTKSDSNSDSDSDVSVKKAPRGRKPGNTKKAAAAPLGLSWFPHVREIRRLREQEKEEKEKRKEKAEKGEEVHSDSDSSAEDEVAKKGRKGRAKAPSSSDSELELEKEVKKPVKKQPSELSRKPNQKEKRGRAEEKPRNKPLKVEQRGRKKSDLIPERRVEKKKEPTVEEKLQKLHSEIKFALKVDNPDIKRCLNALEELGTLQVTSHILQKHTDVVATLKKIRRYKANKDVMEKAAEVYTRLKSRVLGPKMEAIQKANKAGPEKDKGEAEKGQEKLSGGETRNEKGEEETNADLSGPVNGESLSQKAEGTDEKDKSQGPGAGELEAPGEEPDKQ